MRMFSILVSGSISLSVSFFISNLQFLSSKVGRLINSLKINNKLSSIRSVYTIAITVYFLTHGISCISFFSESFPGEMTELITLYNLSLNLRKLITFYRTQHVRAFIRLQMTSSSYWYIFYIDLTVVICLLNGLYVRIV